MAGLAINPRVHGPIWIPSHDQARKQYAPAIELPWPVVRGGRLKVLIAMANSRDRQRFDADGELGAIVTEIRRAMRDDVDVVPCPATTLDQLAEAIRREKPHVFHFSGHGDRDGIFLTGTDGDAVHVKPVTMGTLLEQAEETLRLVILNTCNSAEQARALTGFVDCAIGTSLDITDDAALAFSRSFYSAVGDGSSVRQAFAVAKAVVDPREPDALVLHERPGSDGDAVVLRRTRAATAP